jgi:hypothetical protein
MVCAIPSITMTRHALRITGIWAGSSPYYAGALITAAAGLSAAVNLVKRGELKAWRTFALVLGAFGALAAIASLAVSAVIAIGMSS